MKEIVDINDIKKLVEKIKIDFGTTFTISMAPIQNAIEYDEPGIGGFIYKDLLNDKKIKSCINYLNGQFYEDFSVESYVKTIENGYDSNLIVMGMLGDDNLEEKNEYNKKINKKIWRNIWWCIFMGV